MNIQPYVVRDLMVATGQKKHADIVRYARQIGLVKRGTHWLFTHEEYEKLRKYIGKRVRRRAKRL